MDVNAVIAVMLGFVAVVFDVRQRRIPNWLTFGGALAALLFSGVRHGFAGVAHSGGGWIVGAALFFPFFAFGGMGAGDAKLLAAIAAWLGPVEGVWTAMFATMAGGVIGLGVAISRRYVRRAFSNLWLMMMHWRVAGLGPVPGLTLDDTKAPRLAYAIPITIGVLCTLWRR